MTTKYVCHAKVARQCSSPVGPFYECDRCAARMCNNCKASRGSNKCPACDKPCRPKKLR